MQESSLNRKCKSWAERQIFSKTSVPPETPFFIRLDGWKFKELSESFNLEKPFDEKFAGCLVSSGKAIFEKGFDPTLVYVASDELSILFFNSLPFRGRVEKLDSVMAGLISSAFTLNFKKFFKKNNVVAFDSRIIVVVNNDKIIEYLAWRQMNTWRNHNNAYAYWVLRKLGHKPSEISKKLKGLKTEELHEMMFRHGVNLSTTLAWQRRGILIFKKPVPRKAGSQFVTRWKITENWKLPVFTSKHGVELIKQILEWHAQNCNN